MSKIMSNLSGRPGISAVLVDSAGIVLAAPPDQASMIGRALDNAPLLSAIAETAMNFDPTEGSLSFTAADGSKRAVNFARVAGTQSHLVVSIDEAEVTAAMNRDIRTANLQLGFVSLFVLGALIASEKLIIHSIKMMAATARRLGQGDWSARVSRASLPAEFVPLARALNAMAVRLGQRERELMANNDRLTVIASADMLSGLANRRGFQSRFDFEWLKAQQHDSELSLLMIDVDHFKLYNDAYGHPEGDALSLKAWRNAIRNCRRDNGLRKPAARSFACCCRIRPRTARSRSAKWCVQRFASLPCRTRPAVISKSPSVSAWLAPGRTTICAPAT
jgi:Diguanylate cyclase, GGDEF domain/HAMP domain